MSPSAYKVIFKDSNKEVLVLEPNWLDPTLPPFSYHEDEFKLLWTFLTFVAIDTSTGKDGGWLYTNTDTKSGKYCTISSSVFDDIEGPERVPPKVLGEIIGLWGVNDLDPMAMGVGHGAGQHGEGVGVGGEFPRVPVKQLFEFPALKDLAMEFTQDWRDEVIKEQVEWVSNAREAWKKWYGKGGRLEGREKAGFIQMRESRQGTEGGWGDRLDDEKEKRELDE